jgi:putative membrane protein
MPNKGERLMFEWKNIFRGMLIGASDLVPGVSGGTIGVILGIYDRMIEAISGFFSRDWKKHLGFLIPLGIGAVLAIFLLSHLIKGLLEHYPQPTYFFFLGLIAGIIPYLFKKVDYKNNFRVMHYLLLVVAGLVIASTGFLVQGEATVMEQLTASSGIGLFFSGWLASMAMLLPGVSGSFVLLLLGYYETVINAISSLNIPIILIVGSGIAVGFIVSSKIIRLLLKKLPIVTYALIIGMVIGSVFVIFPGIENNFFLLITSIVSFVVGYYSASFIGKQEQ